MSESPTEVTAALGDDGKPRLLVRWRDPATGDVWSNPNFDLLTIAPDGSLTFSATVDLPDGTGWPPSVPATCDE